MDDQQLLDLVDQAIAALLGGGAVVEWGEGAHRVRHMDLSELLAFKQQLEARIAQATSPMFVPVRSVNV